MSRLTYTDKELAEFENMDCPVKANDLVNRFCDRVCDEFQSNCPFKELGKKLKAYEDKQEQGLLISLPVAEETPVWRIVRHSGGGRVPDWYEKYETEFVLSMLWEWGITVFATESEAEEALARMKGE